MLHCKLHRNEPRCLFKCIESGCKNTFKRYEAFKANFYRKHKVPTNVNSNITARAAFENSANFGAFKCTMALCECRCQDEKAVIAHLKEHIAEGHPVSSPVPGCSNVFKVKSTFSAHMSRKHRDFADSCVSGSSRNSASASSSVQTESVDFDPQVCETGPEISMVESGVDMDMSEDFYDLFLRNVSLFYLKFQGPVSTASFNHSGHY